MDRADRNNNPGDLKAIPSIRWPGQVGVDPGGFAIFDNPEDGDAAATRNLVAQQSVHHLNTLSQILTKYDRNNAPAYIAAASKYTGFSPDQPLNLSDPNTLAKVKAAIYKVEGAGKGYEGVSDTGAPTGGPPDTLQMSSVLQQIMANNDKSAPMQALQRSVDEAGAAEDENVKALGQYRTDLQGIDQQRQADDKANPLNRPPVPNLPGEEGFREQELRGVSNRPMDPMRVMGQFLPMLAILGGAFTKGGAIGSLKAAGAAMTAARQNDTDAIARAHQNWVDESKRLTDQYQLEQDNFNDVIATKADKRADLNVELGVKAAEYGVPAMMALAKMGKTDELIKFVNARQAALTPYISMFNSAQQQDLQQRELAERIAHDKWEETHGNEAVAPPTQAYDAGRDKWLQDHPGDTEGAARAGAEAMRSVEMSMHPTAAGQIGLREERLMVADPVIKAARTNSQYINNIENVTPEDLKTGAGQVRLIDSFTRLATNQAIRGFMVKNAEQYQGLAGQAEMLFQQNKIDPNNPPAAPFLDQAQINAYLAQGKKMVEEIRQAEGRQLAQHAENMEGRGVDPSTGGLTGEDLELAEQYGGYHPNPSKWTLSNDQGQGQGTAPAQALPMPASKSDLQNGQVYQTPRGLGRWDGSQFEAVQ